MIIHSVSARAFSFFLIGKVTDVAEVVVRPYQGDVVRHFQSGPVHVQYFFVGDELLRNLFTVRMNVLPEQAVLYLQHSIQSIFVFMGILYTNHPSVIVCPTAEDAEELGKTYEYVSMKAKLLNVKKDQISIKGDADHMDLAQEAVDYAVDEMDADLDDAEELDF